MRLTSVLAGLLLLPTVALSYTMPVLMRDGVRTDSIVENHSGQGVNIDGTVLKDGGVVLTSPILSTQGTGTVSATHTTRTEYGTGYLHTTVLTITDLPVTFTDDGTTGHSHVTLYTFPLGYVQVQGASLTLACTSAGTFGATGTAVFSLGTVTAAADATLTSTEANIVASATTGAFVASAGAIAAGPVAAPLQIDGHTTAGVVWMNTGDAADPGADSVLTCSGTVIINWAYQGDN